ncbi:MAG: hypothetical protein C4582_01510 [Desulfobacteraceae bacterium]|jgi:hypothetical protein|nr:MAG: hypothetical protein C4582_01510 [Desulfobacteraceae bacterium]
MTTKKAILKNIRANCIECMGGQAQEVQNCSSPACRLFPYRMGRDPAPSRKGEAARKRLVEAGFKAKI